MSVKTARIGPNDPTQGTNAGTNADHDPSTSLSWTLGSWPSRAVALARFAARRPRYTSCVIDTRACPSWSAIIRADAPLSSKIVATVLRYVCVLTHSNSDPARAQL
jgi:hypothetical protein